MPLQSYTPTVRSSAYDLIDQAFNRYVAAQMPQGQLMGGGGGAGLQGSGGGASLQGAGGQQGIGTMGGGGGASLQGSGQGGGNQIPDFMNRQQPGPAFQQSDNPFGPSPVPPGGSGTPAGGPAGGDPNQSLYTILASLLGNQQGQGFKPTSGGMMDRRQQQFNAQSPWFQMGGMAGANQPPQIAGLFDQGNYSRQGSNTPTLD